jgi:GNAT superfamily N-acetyltransferase
LDLETTAGDGSKPPCSDGQNRSLADKVTAIASGANLADHMEREVSESSLTDSSGVTKEPSAVESVQIPVPLVSSAVSSIGKVTEKVAESQAASFEPSRLFGYSLSKRLDGIAGAGTTGWWGDRVLKGYGLCAENLLPYGTAKSEKEVPHVKISPEAFRDARKHRSFAYQKLYTLNDVKRALIHVAPLRFPLPPLVCFDMFKSIYDAPGGRVPLPESGESRITGHCVLILGYDDNQAVFHFLNCWGKKWGDNGFGTLPYPSELKRVFFRPRWNEVFRDKSNNRIRAIVSDVRAPAWGRPPLWLVDLYDREFEILGWLHCTAFADRDILEIEELFIKPEYRQRALGTELLKLAERIAKWCVVSRLGVWIPNQDIIAGREKAVRATFSRSGIQLKRDATRAKEYYWLRGEKIVTS